jgi:hypothetical protein
MPSSSRRSRRAVNVLAAAVALAGFLPPLLLFGQDALRLSEMRRVARTGTDATARILDVRDTGNRFNRMP